MTARAIHRENPETVAPPPPENGDSGHVESAEDDPGEEKKAKRPRRTPRTYHPKYVEAARELCARFLDEVERDPSLLLPMGKYDVSRALGAAPSTLKQTPLLKAV